MRIDLTTLEGLIVVETSPHSDHRGVFTRLYCERELAKIIGDRRIVQVNYSKTKMVGAIRGMHFQLMPHVEMKLVRCLKGRVWDVAVDLRCNSPTFLKWHSEELSANNSRMLVIPEGFAHGFQVMEEDSELRYLHTAFYMPEAEGGICHDDPSIAINWPLPVTDISNRDKHHPLICSDYHGVDV